MSICHVEVFWDDSGRAGWQCLCCGDEDTGYALFKDAEAAGEHHRVEVATEQMIEAGELP